MISRRLKEFYYQLMRVPMQLNGQAYKVFRAPATGNNKRVMVHLGPGQKNYLPGWINLDSNFVSAKKDVWANLEDVLPFRDGSVDVFYSHHVIEHLADRLIVAHFCEMLRALKPGGLIRIGGPNGDMAIDRFLANDKSWFIDFPDVHESIGGKLVNFILCRNEHFTILTKSYLEEILGDAGFEQAVFLLAGKTTSMPELIDSRIMAQEAWSSETHPQTIIVEARKPVGG